MKRIISLLLCAVMLLGVLSACTTIEGDNSGMVIDVYMTNPLTDFDPTMHFDDNSMIKIFDLIYEGLTDLDEEGKWKKALMKSYEFKGNDEDGYSLLITLNSTRWTDGRTVQSADFVYAWKRILDPDFKCEAAALLYDIKNARDVKLGDASIDDVGVSSVDTYVLQIDFDHKIDVDLFLTTQNFISNLAHNGIHVNGIDCLYIGMLIHHPTDGPEHILHGLTQVFPTMCRDHN
jgi:oligopeptide transport system substrate-binding protein